MTKSYAELLRDPRWQRRRLEVLARERFTCESCFSREKTLNVHHSIYRKGAAPWEYSDEELAVLCEDCHASWHEESRRLLLALGHVHDHRRKEILGYAETIAAVSASRHLDSRQVVQELAREAPEGYLSGLCAALYSENGAPERAAAFLRELLSGPPRSHDDIWAFGLALVAVGSKIYRAEAPEEFWRQFEHDARGIDETMAAGRKAPD